MNNHYLTDYSLFFLIMHCLFFFFIWGSSMWRTISIWRMKIEALHRRPHWWLDLIGHRFSLSPNCLFSLTQCSWFKMWVCLMLPEMPGGATVFQWTSLISDSTGNSLFFILISWYIFKFSICSFLFFIYTLNLSACELFIFTFQEIILSNLLPTSQPSKFK